MSTITLNIKTMAGDTIPVEVAQPSSIQEVYFRVYDALPAEVKPPHPYCLHFVMEDEKEQTEMDIRVSYEDDEYGDFSLHGVSFSARESPFQDQEVVSLLIRPDPFYVTLSHGSDVVVVGQDGTETMWNQTDLLVHSNLLGEKDDGPYPDLLLAISFVASQETDALRLFRFRDLHPRWSPGENGYVAQFPAGSFHTAEQLFDNELSAHPDLIRHLYHLLEEEWAWSMELLREGERRIAEEQEERDLLAQEEADHWEEDHEEDHWEEEPDW